jgi:hypothetical protein
MKTMKYLYLFLILLSTLYAQEIGVPYVDTREAVAQSVAFSPDGKTFYTYANNTLTHWGLNPVIRLKTVVLNKDVGLTHPLLKFCVIPNENDLLLIATNDKLAIYDLQKSIIIQTLDINASLVDTLSNNVLVIERNGKVKKINPNNLTLVAEGELDEFYKRHNSDSRMIQLLVKDNNEEFFTIEIENRELKVESKSLVLQSAFVSEQFAPLSDQKSHTLMAQLAKDGSWKQIRGKGNQALNKIWRTLSNTKKLLFIDEMGNDYYSLYDIITERKLFTFFLLKDAFWLIMTPAGYFDGSPEARKYLYMKTPSGESVPIDDTTYQKYHKPIYLNDLTRDK